MFFGPEMAGKRYSGTALDFGYGKVELRRRERPVGNKWVNRLTYGFGQRGYMVDLGLVNEDIWWT